MGTEEIVEWAKVTGVPSEFIAIPPPKTFCDESETCVGCLSPCTYGFPVAKAYDGVYRVERESVSDGVVSEVNSGIAGA